MAIDVGSACVVGDNGQSDGYTRIDKNNPANATGTIDSICIYAQNSMSGIEYAAFTDEGSNIFSTNGDTNGSALTATGGQQTYHTAAGNDFTAFAIATGEYLGHYFTVGRLEMDVSGIGQWYVVGDDIPASSVTFTFVATRSLSVYGTGTESGGAIAPTGVFYGPLYGPLGGPI